MTFDEVIEFMQDKAEGWFRVEKPDHCLLFLYCTNKHRFLYNFNLDIKAATKDYREGRFDPSFVFWDGWNFTPISSEEVTMALL